MKKWSILIFLALFGATTLISCSDDDDDNNVLVVAGNSDIFALTTTNRLVSFPAGNPTAFVTDVAITGLAAMENIVGIDFRPATGELFAMTDQSRLYVLNPTTGVATGVGAAFTPALAGASFGFDFNPVPDRIRVVSNTAQNLRLNPNTGAVAGTDTNLAFDAGDANAAAMPNIVACAYTNPFSGTTTTTIYGIDATLDILVRQGSVGGTPVSPNAGTLFTIGALGVDVTGDTGLDISANGGAFLCTTAAGATTASVYSINLNTGAATLLGTAPAGLRDLVIAPAATPTLVALRSNNSLIRFAPGTPGTVTTAVNITGLQTGEDILGIDYRPSTGELLGLGSSNRLYVVNPTSGVATAIGTTTFATPIAGTHFGFDFNPVPDRIRVVSDTAQNLRLNPFTGGTAAVDGVLAYDAGDANNGMAPRVVASAYTNSFVGTTSTTLYGIDSNLNILVSQGSINSAPVSPNSGTLFTIGALGVDVGDLCGFDISPQGAAFVSSTATGAMDTQLYTLNTTTGALSLLGTIGGGVTIRDLAFMPAAAPRVWATTSNNRLVSFAPGRPDVLLSDVALSGLAMGEGVAGIDMRPATRELLLLGSSSNVYRVNTTTGALTAIAPMAFTPSLMGMNFGMDFNPIPDRIRVVSTSEQNLRLNPNTGTVAAADTNLAFNAGDVNMGADPSVAGCAYTNNFAGTTSTTLYGIDSTLNTLVTVGSPGGTPSSPNGGLLFTVGATGVDTTELVDFDITPQNAAFASMTAPAGTQSMFYSINLTTGAASLLGTIGATTTITGIAYELTGL